MGEPTSEGRKSALKGRLVEGVRLIFIALLATGGFDGEVRLYRVGTGELVKEFVPVPISENLRSQR